MTMLLTGKNNRSNYLTCRQFNTSQSNERFDVTNVLFNGIVVLDFRFHLIQRWLAGNEFLEMLKQQYFVTIKTLQLLKQLHAGCGPTLTLRFLSSCQITLN